MNSVYSSVVNPLNPFYTLSVCCGGSKRDRLFGSDAVPSYILPHLGGRSRTLWLCRGECGAWEQLLTFVYMNIFNVYLYLFMPGIYESDSGPGRPVGPPSCHVSQRWQRRVQDHGGCYGLGYSWTRHVQVSRPLPLFHVTLFCMKISQQGMPLFPQVSPPVGGSQRNRVWLEIHPDELWLQH